MYAQEVEDEVAVVAEMSIAQARVAVAQVVGRVEEWAPLRHLA